MDLKLLAVLVVVFPLLVIGLIALVSQFVIPLVAVRQFSQGYSGMKRVLVIVGGLLLVGLWLLGA